MPRSTFLNLFEHINPEDCGYWFFTSAAHGPRIVAQNVCDGPWIDSIDLRDDTPVPMRYWKVEKGEPSEYPGSGYLISDRLFNILNSCIKGRIESVPAIIETVKGDGLWSNYRFFKVTSVMSFHDLWSGKGTEQIYRIKDYPAFVVSSQVRECMENLCPGDFEFDEPILIGESV